MKPHHVTFEQAKKLKEKGFTIQNGYACREGWMNYFSSFTGETGEPENDNGYCYDRLGNAHLIECPEHWQVVDWLLEKHGIWVHVNTDIKKEYYFECLRITKVKNVIGYPERVGFVFERFTSPSQAYSAAFDYILDKIL